MERPTNNYYIYSETHTCTIYIYVATSKMVVHIMVSCLKQTYMINPRCRWEAAKGRYIMEITHFEKFEHFFFIYMYKVWYALNNYTKYHKYITKIYN